ncbi:Putative esterase [Rosistilla carotiformis]|uniref:Esterase n=1 Tax=Rosistilla carotiformis TaxID=2528017 RepID=A0A518JZ97_9BACT|nr:alpha/beta hydrolase-fold protein [Rosistilla carotiformis]QDV70862.1 Putative esterase [Rosistilla carotiformis]
MLCRHERLPFDKSTRRVSLFSLKNRGEPDDVVVYCSDGQSIGAFAQQFFNAFGADCFWFVGVDCSTEHRNAEYVIGRDDSIFEMHECFFVNTVVDWATKAIGIQHSRGQSAVFGYSCGGAFAASIGIRHPDVYGTIFAFSIAGRPITNFDAKPEADLSELSFCFRSGSREPKGMRSYMKRLENWLRSADVQVNNKTLAGGHEFALWSAGLNESISAAYELTHNNAVNHSRRQRGF